MYTGLNHLHSALRWLALLLIVIALVRSIKGLTGNKPFTKGDNSAGVFTLIFFHLQLVIGLVMYFMSPYFKQLQQGASEVMQSSILRFFAVEHLVAMIIAIALVTIGRVRSKKAREDRAKHKSIVIFFGIALLIVLWAIPWPFTEVGQGRGWF